MNGRSVSSNRAISRGSRGPWHHRSELRVSARYRGQLSSSRVTFLLYAGLPLSTLQTTVLQDKRGRKFPLWNRFRIYREPMGLRNASLHAMYCTRWKVRQLLLLTLSLPKQFLANISNQIYTAPLRLRPLVLTHAFTSAYTSPVRYTVYASWSRRRQTLDIQKRPPPTVILFIVRNHAEIYRKGSRGASRGPTRA